MDVIAVRSFNNYFLANITLTKLQDAGFECWLRDEHTVTIDPLLTNAVGGIKLVVKDTDLPAVTDLLKHFDEEYMKSVKCPQCGATAITEINKPGAVNFVTAILSWLFTNYAVAPEQVYKCGKCGFESKTLPTTINEDDLHE